jgi:hypothetical protein
MSAVAVPFCRAAQPVAILTAVLHQDIYFITCCGVHWCTTGVAKAGSWSRLSSISRILQELWEGDRRGSNPRPSEPQSAHPCFQVLPNVAESAYLSRFICWWLPAVSGCCALSGVKVVSAPPLYAVLVEGVVLPPLEAQGPQEGESWLGGYSAYHWGA